MQQPDTLQITVNDASETVIVNAPAEKPEVSKTKPAAEAAAN